MTPIFLLFIVGIALLATDVFVASLVIAVIGGISMLAGCVFAYRDFGVFGALIASGIAAVLLISALYAELVLLPKSRLGKGLVVESTAGSRTQPPISSPGGLVGSSATAETTLAPSGYVTVAGRRYEAFCRSGHAEKGVELLVVGEDNFRLIVSKS